MIKIDTQLPARIATVIVEDIQVAEDKRAYEKLENCASDYRARYNQTPIGSVAGAQMARQLFRAIGIDPTKRRPSSEALLKRALQGKALYAVNTLVDVGNWCSLDFLLPIGIYDLDKTEGEITVRLGAETDVYLAINNRELSLYNRYVIADEKGAFGSPITDSKRTSIDTTTTQALLVIYAPQDVDPETLQAQAKLFAERVIGVCGGNVVG